MSNPLEWPDSYDAKEGILVNSGFLDGLEVKEAMAAAIRKVEELGIGRGRVNFRLRDAIFSRQRYWGEPFPFYYKNGIPHTLPENELPLTLPEVDVYLPTSTGEPPLARAENWTYEGYSLETSTMPGFAGSSGYYFRYMDPRNPEAYFSKQAVDYWQNVDLYIGGAEHATGHLIYARFWCKFLYDIGLSPVEEPFKKLINQGMIQGVSMVVEVVSFLEDAFLDYCNDKFNFDKETYQKPISDLGESNPPNLLLEEDKKRNIVFIMPVQMFNKLPWGMTIRIPIDYVELKGTEWVLSNKQLEKLKKEHLQFRDYRIAQKEDVAFIKRELPTLPDFEEYIRDGEVVTVPIVEKMSKSLHNVQNPDELIEKYGADTLRLYEMFLGPLEQSKPWDTKGIEGVFRFIRKFWKLYHDENNNYRTTSDAPTLQELKVLHRAIKKITDDIERFSFNTVVSALMIAVNELSELKCHKQSILNPLTILISPYAPHLAEELWQLAGNAGSVSFAELPACNAEYLIENEYEYPVSFNGKMRFTLSLPTEMATADIETAVLAHEKTLHYLGGNPPRKVIIVPKKIINIVI